MAHYALSIEAVKGDWKHNPEVVTAYRAIIYEREFIEGQDTPVRSIHDILEAETLLDLELFFTYDYAERADVLSVQMPDGSWEEPDCLSTWEAAEATYGFPVDLFNQDPLQKK